MTSTARVGSSLAVCALSLAAAHGTGCLFFPRPPDRALEPGDHLLTIDHGGRTREYTLHVPPQYTGRKHLPLVFMLHGGFGSSENAARDYHWTDKADAEGFLVCYPDGTGVVQTWNGVHCCGFAHRNDVDDVGFIAALVDELRGVVKVDQRRIFATGMSNGGMLSHRLGAERPDLFAAIAPVACAVGGQVDPTSPLLLPNPPASPVPVIMYHGVLDQSVLYDGGETQAGVGDRVDVSVAESAAFWVEANGCEPTPARTTSGNIIRDAWAPNGNGADVMLVTLQDQGHAWPGGLMPFPGADEPSQEISATDEIWEFFVAHPKPADK